MERLIIMIFRNFLIAIYTVHVSWKVPGQNFVKFRFALFEGLCGLLNIMK